MTESLREILIRKAIEDSQDWKRVLFEPEHFQDDPELTPGHGMLTSYGARDSHTRTIYITSDHWPVPDAELAVTYLRLCRELVPDQSGMITKCVPYRNPPPPPWPDVPAPPSFGRRSDVPLVHADISACYARLYVGVTPDCWFPSDEGSFATGRIDWFRRDEWLEMKRPRNHLWGLMCRAPSFISTRRSYNMATTFAPHLTAFVMACLHAIAADARDLFGAVYWRDNDEVWLPEANLLYFQEWLRFVWRLELHNVTQVPQTTSNISEFDHVNDYSLSYRTFLNESWRWADDAQQAAQLSSGIPAAA